MQIPCGGTALYGVVTPHHPLYGMALVCARHAKRKYYFLYGPERCPQDFPSDKLPNLAQICIQGAGGRPVIEEGKVQSNAQNIQRSRAKKAALKTTMLNSYAQLLEEKQQLALLVESHDLRYQELTEECTAAKMDCQILQGRLEESQAKQTEASNNWVRLYDHAQQLTQLCASQKVKLDEQQNEVIVLKQRLLEFGSF